MVTAALTSAPVVAISLTIPIVMTAVTTSGVSVDAAIIASIVAMGATTFETLPVNGGVLLALGVCKCTHKESYAGFAVASVLATTVGAVVCTIVGLAFPMLP